MNTIYPFLEPFFNFWNYLTHDQYYEKLNEFQGGINPGNEWHTKFLKADQNKHLSKIEYLQSQFKKEPSFYDIFWDNKLRLTFLAGFERLISFRQGQSLLSSRFMLFNNNSSVLNSFFEQGVFRGFFRGYLINLIHFASVQYHSLLWSYNTSISTHLLIASLMETAFYPLDTVKTLIYCDLNRKYQGARHCLRSVLSTSGLAHLYRGLSLKLVYNTAFLLNLRNMYDGNSLIYISLPLWFLTYPLLTIKTRLQVCDTKLSYQSLENFTKASERIFRNQSIGSLYAGFIPFATLNLVFSYTFYALYSDKAAQKALFESAEELIKIEKIQ